MPKDATTLATSRCTPRAPRDGGKRIEENVRHGGAPEPVPGMGES
jgi:hypothetical protein